jgi:predicted ATPase
MFEVRVRDFGPIREGSVTLRPLTILIGPNNAGKSYLALLTYALLNPFRIGVGFGVGFGSPSSLPLPDELHMTDELKKWILDRREHKQTIIYFDDLPDQVKDYYRNAVSNFIPSVTFFLNQELQRCFGGELVDLARNQFKDNFCLSVEQSQPSLHLEWVLKNSKLDVEAQKFDISGQGFSFSDVLVTGWPRYVNEEIILSLGRYIFQNFNRSAYYFPASRSWILQVHKALASIMVSRSPLVGIQSFGIPRLSGVVADFISHLLRLERQRRTGLSEVVADFLESKISRGKIDLQSSDARFEYPEIYYESEGVRFPLHRTSSMVSELAPIILFLRYVVEKGNFLIIEEPEAHLHPDNQRIFARAIVKLIRMGVQVLITTHSDYFVQQLSNFILLSGQVPDKRVKLGYSEDDYLLAKEVAAYLFNFAASGTGSVIKELKVTEEDGIPEDEFVKIAEAIYDETVRLQRSIKS